jgi:CTP:molybdopterin cytidylyltransferase MocA
MNKKGMVVAIDNLAEPAPPVDVVIMAAGKGTRMMSTLPKVAAPPGRTSPDCPRAANRAHPANP